MIMPEEPLSWVNLPINCVIEERASGLTAFFCRMSGRGAQNLVLTFPKTLAIGHLTSLRPQLSQM